jgi:ankyrin repeat protein
MVRSLLEPGADVNHRYHYPLRRAVIAGHLPVATLLVERGGDPNYIGSGWHGYNNSVLYWARSENLKDMEDLLLQYGATSIYYQWDV